MKFSEFNDIMKSTIKGYATDEIENQTTLGWKHLA